MTVGSLFLVVVLLAALGGAAAAFLVIRGDRGSLVWMRWLTWISLGFAAGAALLLMALILAQRYDIAYVYQYTSQDLAFGYRLSAFWAGQEGSFLLWLLLGAVFTVLQLRRARQFEPYVVFFMLLVQAGLAVFLLVDSPFRSLGRVVTDGFGMNPLLQNPWMVTHPPVLFVGYAGLVVPFAYALAGLWRRDYDEWVKLALPWTLLGWLFLGAGIYLGAYWAYETLGWGGYWGWDLVENSSLIPWLTGTALLHGLLIQRYRQRLRHGNLILAIGTFFLVLYATYLTRSGILSEISTHSFVETGLTPWMVGLLLATLAIAVGFLVSRWRDIPRSPVLAGKDQESLMEGDVSGTVGRTGGSWLSRDFTFLLTILILLLVTAPIWLGTLAPVVTKIVQGTPVKVDESFYPVATGPWVLVMLAVLCLCPFLGWQESEWKRLRGLLIIPAVISVLAVVAAVLVGARQPYSLLFILLAAFALGSNAAMVVRTARGGILRLGGYLTHVGVGLVIVGIVASSAYNVDGPSLVLVEGQPQEALGYQFTFVGWQETPGEKPALRVEVERGGDRFIALPQLYNNPQDNSLMATPHIHHYLTHDVYIAAEGYEPGQAEEIVQVSEGQTVQAAGYELTLETLVPHDGTVEALLVVAGGDPRGLITATYAISDVDAPYQPVMLPGGGMLTVVQVDFAPAGLFWVDETTPVLVGSYQARLMDFTMQPHGNLTDTIVAGAVVEFTGPEGTVVVTPTQIVGPDDVQTPPVEIAPGISVRLVRMAVEQGAAQIQVDGITVGPQATLQVQGAGSSAGLARVHVSIKPGISLLWLGGLLLLLGTGVAVVRRWLEGRRSS
jgi:cytochrome c-type biogenesis protein CcmF